MQSFHCLALVRSLKMLEGLEKVSSNRLYYEKEKYNWQKKKEICSHGYRIVVSKKHTHIKWIKWNKMTAIYIYICLNLSSMVFNVENIYRKFWNNARTYLYGIFQKKCKDVHIICAYLFTSCSKFEINGRDQIWNYSYHTAAIITSIFVELYLKKHLIK